MRKRIIPAIIAENQERLEELLKKIPSQVRLVQLDIMDGKFLRSKSLWYDFKLPKNNLKYEAHLMVQNPKKWVETHAKKVDVVIFHLETVKNPHELIQLIRRKKKQVGVAINPKTPVKQLIGVLDHVDQITIMTVTPGKYGATFLPACLKKVKRLRKLSEKLSIEVDGGINPKTIKQAKKAGANKFISGSYLLKQPNMREGLRTLRNLL